MNSLFYKKSDVEFADHPKFTGVSIGVLVSAKDTNTASVCLLDIEPGTEIPIHIHDPQADSIFVVSGGGKIFVNGEWQAIGPGDYIFVPAGDQHGITTTEESLRIFVHHSPPLM